MQPHGEANPSLEAEHPVANGMTHRTIHSTSNEFYICGSVHHQSILLNNQRDAALSSRIYSSLQGYSMI
jgi:hypothetical protein